MGGFRGRGGGSSPGAPAAPAAATGAPAPVADDVPRRRPHRTSPPAAGVGRWDVIDARGHARPSAAAPEASAAVVPRVIRPVVERVVRPVPPEGVVVDPGPIVIGAVGDEAGGPWPPGVRVRPDHEAPAAAVPVVDRVGAVVLVHLPLVAEVGGIAGEVV